MVLDSDNEEEYKEGGDEGSGDAGEDSDFSTLWNDRSKAKKSPPTAAPRRAARQRTKVNYFDEDEDDDDIDSIMVK